MKEVKDRICEESKKSLITLNNKTFSSEDLSFIVNNKVIYFSNSIKDEDKRFSKDCDKLLYFFLSKLDYLIDPLLKDISFIKKEDVSDERYIQISAYFTYLTKVIKWLVRSVNFFNYNTYWEGFMNDNYYPLEMYLKENNNGKRSLSELSEKTYLAIGTLSSTFYPDDKIIRPTPETQANFDAIEKFINKYKSDMKSEEFEANAVVNKIKDTFGKNKQKDSISKSKIVNILNDSLVYENKLIPMERGQKSMAKLFLDNAKIYRGETLIKRGAELDISTLKDAGGYNSEEAFRNALAKFRSKLKGFPIKIENTQTKKYQMLIKYPKTQK